MILITAMCLILLFCYLMLNSDGSTPLMAASWNGQHNIVALLLQHGADVNATNVYVFG